MENASKTLIIAGAILISILLVTSGIIIFNSTRGITDNAGTVGNEVKWTVAREKAKIILDKIGIEDDNAYNDYLISTYAYEVISNGRTEEIGHEITGAQVRELKELVTERCRRLTGKGYDAEKTHITSSNSFVIRYNEVTDEIEEVIPIEDKKLYRVRFSRYQGNEPVFSIQVLKPS